MSRALVVLALLASAAHATTLVMLVSQQAAVIASDSLAHGSGRGVITVSRKKVSRVNPKLIVGTAGVAALADGRGVQTDLHDFVVAAAGKGAWRTPHEDAVRLATALRAELAALERIPLPGQPDRGVNPTVTVFLTGKNRRGIWAIRITIPGALSPAIGYHRALFGPARVEDVVVRSDAATAEIVSRLPEVVDRAADQVEAPGPEWPALRKLVDPRVPLSAKVLQAAARELVTITMKADPEIGGAIQLESL